MNSSEIRSRFLAFFAAHGHTIVPSGSLVPGNDPTLLFANAGMVQFKDVFVGLEQRPYKRAVTAQKCMRVSGKHNDLETVGPSPRHHTFFEMLGNFSFGDYFKRNAIILAWQFLTVELQLDPQRLWPTVYLDDDEAFALWQEIAGMPAARISRLGREDNFWTMGDTGPCGPDSEIMYDRGTQYCTCHRDDCSPATGCDRFLEIWNLVFMQFEALQDGSVVPLPKPSVDTGLGLERITSILQGVDSNYGTDLFMPIILKVQSLLGHSDAQRLANPTPYRVIADHSRALAFLIADGVLPGNEGRSYVLRMVLRRAARYGRMLGFQQPFLAETVQSVIDLMGGHYTELVARADFIRQVVTREEVQFLSTLSQGLVRLDEVVARVRTAGETVIPGAEAFRLYDTYGFPLELTRDALAESGMTVDEAGFRQAMAQQKERARSAKQTSLGAAADIYQHLGLAPSQFTGYAGTSGGGTVVAMLSDGKAVDRISAGQEAEVVLDSTPFYGESGGQVGDSGWLRTEFGSARVLDTYHPITSITTHRISLEEGSLAVGDQVQAEVDCERRLDIARNHTATHLLHRALRQVLGEHAAQSGSLVTDQVLRFDFSHLQALSADELSEVEDRVNAAIRDARPVFTEVMPYDQAIRGGVVALFGEKYGSEVRVVNVEDFSAELCGGTHVRNTGEIGLLLITSEGSIGSGLRRIEAVTGRAALQLVRSRNQTMLDMRQTLGAKAGEELRRTQALLVELEQARRQLEADQRQFAEAEVDRLLESGREINGVYLLTVQVHASSAEALREMADRFCDKFGSAIVALGAVINGKPLLVVSVTPDVIARGAHAGQMVAAAAKEVGGGGGGKPNMAQAGGRDPVRLPDALAKITALAEAVLSQV
ncbi:MAG: alanine--tRNA ligase [Chloroflexi bacterium]|nr:alanine--tRNA ligase [Chloroflexota bacterium]